VSCPLLLSLCVFALSLYTDGSLRARERESERVGERESVCVRVDVDACVCFPVSVFPLISSIVDACRKANPEARPRCGQIVKALELILIDASIVDKSGKKFWRKHFFRQDKYVVERPIDIQRGGLQRSRWVCRSRLTFADALPCLSHPI
jgi:hypothetical protein